MNTRTLTPRFFADRDRAAQWRAYLTRNSLPGAPADFDGIGEMLGSFLGPVWNGLTEGTTLPASWPPGGPWRPDSVPVEEATP